MGVAASQQTLFKKKKKGGKSNLWAEAVGY